MKRNKKGFTLVELVIVIAVIAILAGVLIAVFSGVVRRANENAELQQIKNDELKQKAEDVLVKLDNANWFSWEDFENSLAEKMTQVYKDNANRTTGLTEEQLNAAVADSVKKALDEYVQKNATSETVITEAQIKAIIENAFAEAKLGGVTEEQVRTIVNTAVNGINTVSKADIQRIVDAATSKGLTAAQVAEVIGNSKLAKKDDTDALSAKVDDALAAINGLSSLTKQDVEDAIIELVPVTYTVHDEAKYYEMLSRLHSFSTIIIAEDFVYAEENTTKELKITNVVGDKTLTIKGIALEKLTVDAPKATIYLVSDAKTVEITSTNDHSFHVVGKVNDKLTINSGRVVLEKGAVVNYLKAAPSLNATVTVQLEEDSKIIDTLETEYQEWGFTAGNRDFIVIENNGNVNLTNLTASYALQQPSAVHTTTNVVIKNGRNATGTTAEVIDADEAMPDVDIIIDDTSYVTDTINEQKVLKSMTDEDAVRVGYVARIENSYYETLAAAVNAAVDGDTIVMLKDDTLTATVIVSKTIEIDLNGQTVGRSNIVSAIGVIDGNLTISDSVGTGKILGNGQSVYTNAEGDTLTINGGTIQGSTYGVRIVKGDTVTINGGTIIGGSGGYGIYNLAAKTLNITGGSISGAYAINTKSANCSITVSGGTLTGTSYGINNSATATITISGSTISATASNSYAIQNTAANTVITVLSGTVSGGNRAINTNKADSSITVKDGTISGGTYGIVNSGTLTVNGGTIKANAYYGISNSGTLIMNGGTVIGGTHESYGRGINNSAGTVTINGGTIRLEAQTASMQVAVDNRKTLVINGGNIITNAIGVYSTDSFSMTGGSININGESQGIQTFGTTNITGGEIRCNNNTETGINVAGGSLTISDVNIYGGLIGIYGQGTSTIAINGEDVYIESIKCVWLNSANCTCNISAGTFNGGSEVCYAQNGFFTISGGTFTGGETLQEEITTDKHRYNLNCLDASYTAGTAGYTVTGGTFYQFDPTHNRAEGEWTNFSIDGYHSVYNDETGYYTVVANN